MVVSATPAEALEREWGEHDLREHVALIAGQECGSKKEHLALAAVGRYEPANILMVGDAPGDCNAAKANGVLFYPIDPGVRRCVVAAVFRGGLAAVFRRDVRGRIHGRADCPVRVAVAGPSRRGNDAKSGRRVDQSHVLNTMLTVASETAWLTADLSTASGRASKPRILSWVRCRNSAHERKRSGWLALIWVYPRVQTKNGVFALVVNHHIELYSFENGKVLLERASIVTGPSWTRWHGHERRTFPTAPRPVAEI